jgi:uncharacterized protein (UPF0332 family)
MMSYSEDLIAQAELLLKVSKKKPNQANLRRSISAAYYALFHFLISEASSRILPQRSAVLRQAISRSISHADIKNVCDQLIKKDLQTMKQQVRSMLPRLPTALIRSLCESFIDLQQSRHAADYDLGTAVKKLKAEESVKRAQNAIASWRHVPDQEKEILLVLVLFQSRLRAD